MMRTPCPPAIGRPTDSAALATGAATSRAPSAAQMPNGRKRIQAQGTARRGSTKGSARCTYASSDAQRGDRPSPPGPLPETGIGVLRRGLVGAQLKADAVRDDLERGKTARGNDAFEGLARVRRAQQAQPKDPAREERAHRRQMHAGDFAIDRLERRILAQVED